MKIENLEDLLAHEIRDLYSAETQLVDALPKLAGASSSSELTEAFQAHLDETQEHVRRLEQVGELLNIKLSGHRCKGIEGIIAEGSEYAKSKDIDSRARDAALIAAAQRAEHYEIAGYGCVTTYCDVLGHVEAKELLGATLDEERNADEKLTAIALQVANPEAANA